MRINRNCALCGAPILSPNGRRKYCSDECATEAHRRQARENFRRRYAEMREVELARTHKWYMENKETKKASRQKWGEANREHLKAYYRERYRREKAVQH